MARSNVELIVDATNAINPLKRVAKETNRTEKQVSLLQKAIKAQSKAVDFAKAKLIGFGNAAKKSFEKARKAAERLQAKLGGLKGAIVSLGVVALTKRVIGQAASFAQTQVRLKALSAEYGEFGQIQKLVKQNAETFNQSQAESASNFADVFARLRPLGTSLEDIQTVYKGFNATALASGTSAAAASGAFLQLSQALGSGRLQGDEFRSVAEQVPGILKLVADEMGVTVGQLKQLGSDGKITSDILINSLAKGFEENKDKIQQLLAESPAQKFKEFSNATSELSNAVGTELLPVVTPAVQELTKLLKVVGDLPGPIKTTGAAILGLVAAFVALSPLIAGVKIALAGITGAGLLAAGPWLALAAGVTAVVVALNRYNALKQPNIKNLERVGRQLTKVGKQIDRVQAKLDKTTDKRAREALQSDLDSLREQRQRIVKEFNRLTALIPPNVNEPTQPTKEDEDPKLTAEQLAALEKAAKQLKVAQMSAANEQDLLAFDKKIADAIRAGDKINQIILQGQRKILGIRQQLSLALEGVTDEKIKQAKMDEALSEVQRVEIDTETKLLALEKDKTAELEKQAALAVKIVSNAAGDSQDALGNRQQDLKQIQNFGNKEAEFIARVDDLVLNKGVDFQTAFDIESKLKKANEELVKMQSNADFISGIGNQLSTGITGALVGAVQGTKNLGEAFQNLASDIFAAIGQALILKAVTSAIGAPGVGGEAGTGLLGMIFRADGGPVSANQPYIVGEEGPELMIPSSSGTVLSNSDTRQHLNNQSSQSQSLNVRFESQVINGVEYVTAEQHRQGMTQAAERGRAMTLTTLQNSPRTRSKVGI